MIHERLTSETWDADEPRIKDRVGGKIIYYKANGSSEDVGAIRQELDMMALAAQHGVLVPRVWSYNRAEELEVCMIEYVEGTPLEKLDADDPLARKAISVVEAYISAMESVQRPTTLNNQHPLVQSLQVPATSSDVYRHLLATIRFHAQRYQLQFPEETVRELESMFPTEPCVLAHGDLAGNNNVIVSPDGTVKLIDWECAGFLPLHISRAVSKTLDDSSRLGGMIRSLCAAAQSGTFGEREKFGAALADFVCYAHTFQSSIE
jgi:aminoglycoside phosphotransferase